MVSPEGSALRLSSHGHPAVGCRLRREMMAKKVVRTQRTRVEDGRRSMVRYEFEVDTRLACREEKGAPSQTSEECIATMCVRYLAEERGPGWTGALFQYLREEGLLDPLHWLPNDVQELYDARKAA